MHVSRNHTLYLDPLYEYYASCIRATELERSLLTVCLKDSIILQSSCQYLLM
jgi:hypothetical protein